MTEELATEAAGIRAAIVQLESVGGQRRYSQQLQERIVSYLEAGASAGQRREDLANAAGVPVKTTDRWIRHRRRDGVAVEAKSLAPVRVAVEGAGRERVKRGLVLVSRNGVRVEGIDVASAISILRALG